MTQQQHFSKKPMKIICIKGGISTVGKICPVLFPVFKKLWNLGLPCEQKLLN